MNCPVHGYEQVSGPRSALWKHHSRYQLPRTPLGSPKNGALVGPPYGDGSFGLQPPVHDIAIRIASHEARVAMHDLGTVDLGGVAAEDVAGLGDATGSRLALDVDRHGPRRAEMGGREAGWGDDRRKEMAVGCVRGRGHLPCRSGMAAFRVTEGL